MDYAKKHAQIIDRLINEDKNFDLLSGNGGAAQVLLKMYVMLNDRRYLDMAVRAVEVLERAAVTQEKGIGWPAERDMPAMAGMAHGNSGILMPVISLWKITGEDNSRGWRNKYGSMKNMYMMKKSITGQICGHQRGKGDDTGRWPGVMAPEVYFFPD